MYIKGNDYVVDHLPAGIAGQVYVVLSKSSTKFADEYYIAGPAIIEVKFPSQYIIALIVTKTHIRFTPRARLTSISDNKPRKRRKRKGG